MSMNSSSEHSAGLLLPGPQQPLRRPAALRNVAIYWLITSGSIFAGLLLFFLWELGQFAFGTARLFAFYLMPLALSAFCFYSATRSWAPRAAIAIACLWALAYGGEILLTYRNLLAWQDLESADPRSPAEVAETLRRDGQDAWPSFMPGVLRGQDTLGKKEPIALGGVANVRTVHCNEGQPSYLIYQSDQFGFLNGSDAYHSHAPAIMMIGDSYVQGHCVKVDERIVSRLRKHFPASLNFGIGDNGPLLELATLREYGQYLKPRIVIWVFFEGNDLIDLDAEKKLPALTAFLDPKHRLGFPERQAIIDRRLQSYLLVNRGVDNSSLFAWNSLRTKILPFLSLTNMWRFTGLPYGSAGYDYDLMEQILRVARDEVSSFGGEMILVYIPFAKNLQGLGFYTAGRNYVRQKILDIASDLQLPVIDLYLRIVELGGYSAVTNAVGSHFNSRGYAMVADLMVDFLCTTGRGHRIGPASCPAREGG
jgi:hypothetical protein